MCKVKLKRKKRERERESCDEILLRDWNFALSASSIVLGTYIPSHVPILIEEVLRFI